MGYLACDKCGGCYELQKGESPNDFNLKCQCGGNLDYVENLHVKKEDSIKPRRINWWTLTIGIVVTVFLGFLLGLIGFIIATTIIGYSVGGDYKNGAIHGALAGIIGGFIVIIIGNILKLIVSPGHISLLMIAGTLLGVIIYAIAGVVCGAIGALIKDKKRN